MMSMKSILSSLFCFSLLLSVNVGVNADLMQPRNLLGSFTEKLEANKMKLQKHFESMEHNLMLPPTSKLRGGAGDVQKKQPQDRDLQSADQITAVFLFSFMTMFITLLINLSEELEDEFGK